MYNSEILITFPVFLLLHIRCSMRIVSEHFRIFRTRTVHLVYFTSKSSNRFEFFGEPWRQGRTRSDPVTLHQSLFPFSYKDLAGLNFSAFSFKSLSFISSSRSQKSEIYNSAHHGQGYRLAPRPLCGPLPSSGGRTSYATRRLCHRRSTFLQFPPIFTTSQMK
jgi:hypothetical protein